MMIKSHLKFLNTLNEFNINNGIENLREFNISVEKLVEEKK
jgi:hypothetical protein